MLLVTRQFSHRAVAIVSLLAGPVGLTVLSAQQPAAAANPEAAQVLAQTQVLPLLQLQMPSSSEMGAAAQSLRKAVHRSLIGRATLDPQLAGGEGAAQHQLTVVADKGDVNGRARFYLPVNNNSDLIITFTSPLTSGAATFATDTGLSPNVSLNAGLKMSWSFKDRVRSGEENSPDSGRQFLQGLGRGLGLPTENVAATLEALRRVAVITQGIRSVPPESPESRGAPAQLAAALLSTNQSRLANILASPGIVNSPDRFWTAVAQDPTIIKTAWSGYLTPAYESNRAAGKYLTADKFEEKEFDERTSVVSVSTGVSHIAEVNTPGGEPGQTTNTPLFFAGLSFKAGKTLAVADASNICVTRANGATECLDLPVGQPARSDLRSFTAEYRHWELNRSLGVNPKYTFTRKNVDGAPATDATVIHSFEVPIYLMHKVTDVTNPKFDFGSDLIGGVSIGWRHTRIGTREPKEGVVLTLFLTKAFGLP